LEADIADIFQYGIISEIRIQSKEKMRVFSTSFSNSTKIMGKPTGFGRLSTPKCANKPPHELPPPLGTVSKYFKL
jgi:hypothetical protein